MAMQTIKLGGFVDEEVTRINANFAEISSDYAKTSEIPDVPTKTSDLQNDSGFITSAAIPSDLGGFTNNVGYVKATDSAITNKVEKEAGKGLTENNYTTAEKTKLAGLTAPAQIALSTSDFGAAAADGYVYATKSITSGTPVAVFRANGSNYERVAAALEKSGSNVVIGSSEAFSGYVLCI